MYSIAIHQISEPEKFWGTDLQLPDGLTLHTVAPNHDGTRAVCVWESESLDSVREFVETTSGAITTNEYGVPSFFVGREDGKRRGARAASRL